MNILLETLENSIDSCTAIMPPDKIFDEAQDPQADNDENRAIEATQEIADIVQDLHKLQELKQILQDKEQSLKDTVINYMELHNTLTINNKPIILWKNCTRSSFDLTTFKAEYPELYSLFLKETTSRIFRLS